MDQISDVIRAPFVRIEPECDGEGWIVITPNGHGWILGNRSAEKSAGTIDSGGVHE